MIIELFGFEIEFYHIFFILAVIWAIKKFLRSDTSLFDRDEEESKMEDNSDGDVEEDDDRYTCYVCGRRVDDALTCSECEEDICDRCYIDFDNAGVEICKKCIENKYPREKITKIVKIKEPINVKKYEDKYKDKFKIDSSQFE